MNVAEVLRAHGLVPIVPTCPQTLGTLKPKRDAMSPLSPLSPPEKASSAESCTQPLPPGERLATIGRMRGELQRLARLEGIDLTHVHRLDDADILAIPDDYTERNLRAYLRALVASAAMDAGLIPQGWRGAQAAICDGCGPVLLWPGAPDRLKACPWCFRRKAGKAIPRPKDAQAHLIQTGRD